MADNYLQLLAEASVVFTPGAPVSRKDLFSGRHDQLVRVIETIPMPGRHPVVFGQRGVGKTSLANILAESIEGIYPLRTSCDGSDTFTTIWHRVLAAVPLQIDREQPGLSRQVISEMVSLASLLPSQEVTPAHVAAALARLSAPGWIVVVLDEFDKVRDQGTRAKTADLIKVLSDSPRSRVSLVVVGVARSIGQLIGEHPSIDRNLVHIELPKMVDEEIRDILTNGCNRLGLDVTPTVLDEACLLADGFPHYAHLLGLQAAKACFQSAQKVIDHAEFTVACTTAVDDAIEKYRDAYAFATSTTQQSRYPQVLCSCAHADHDDRGAFRATDVVDAMSKVFNVDVSLQSVVPALGEFCKRERGEVLEKVPVGKRHRYRFLDPMLRPFLRIKTQSVLAEALQRT